MKQKIAGVVAKRRSGASRGLIAFLVFAGSVILGGIVGDGLASLLNLGSFLGAFTGIVVVLPVTFVLYRFLSKRFAHQQIG